MAKKRKVSHIPNRTHPDRPRPKSSSALAASSAKKQHPKRQKQQQQNKQPSQEKPTIPFKPHEHILLIGEGDLSFAASLVRHHKCTSVTATVLEKNREELEGKYPHVGENIDVFLAKEDEDGPSADKEGSDAEDEGKEDGWSDEDADSDEETKKPPARDNRIVYHIDATKPLPNSLLSQRGPFSTIIFNFPHVGGLSTDVNRQVRHNQSLLVSFFTSVLSSAPNPSKPFALVPGGSIIVTLFEAEPYTLWNVRDLARHAGLAVEKSFKFQAEAYPGYKHARTCGVIEGGGWKGEERRARSYVFRRKGELGSQGPAAGGKKRKKGRESDDEDDD
ncbi:hypothetical protein NLU13_7022 [Sarocladium strictum]|uniref:25S rRNA (uridine-N(3))-methyltransferase BMT5-like domain-containing protein n=1 Tax=Sarocladium strictum TaxID=5046 RepID=A0AA39GEH4_SARSR|nr:hypothetical protein NLU13_7022 [Sarocladium strictum]